jgi:hypothetical protein
MASVLFEVRRISGMALEAHLVRLVEEFQRPLIPSVGGMKIVAVPAMGAALLITL